MTDTTRKRWIGLIRDDGKVEYNARFVLGSAAAETLEDGRLYGPEEIDDLAEGFELGNGKFVKAPLFLQTCSQNPASQDHKRKWRCEVLW